MADIRIGISGWRYAGWRGVFYPEKLVQSQELAFASRQVQTIEINGSHYSLQRRKSYADWHDVSPDGFVYSVKGPRYLTHMLRFRGDETLPALANFFASGLFELREKLGPILWQFPPSFKFDPESFEGLLAQLPSDTGKAGALARRHDHRVKDPCPVPYCEHRLRHAIEVRHRSFCDPEFIALLRKHDMGLVVSDSVADWPYAEDLTSDFVYMRLHGTDTLYSGEYSDAALERWAARIRAWSTGGQPEDARLISENPARRGRSRDIYCYFDNDMKVQAPKDAKRLSTLLSRTA